MGCDTIYDDNGNAIGIACSRGPKARCTVCKSRPATKLCDFALSGSKAGQTCDRAMCERCAAHAGRNLDYCPAHAELVKKGASSP